MNTLDGYKAKTLLTMLLFSAFWVPSLWADQPRRVAVLSFDLGDNAKHNAKTFLGIDTNLGRDLSDQLVVRLVSDGKFIVAERSELDKIIKEQNLSNADRFDPSQASKIGRLAGVSAVVIGTVTEVSGTDEPTKKGKWTAMVGYVEHTVTINVGVTARVVDTNTGNIIFGNTYRGEASKTQAGMKGGTTAKGQTVADTMGTDFGNHLLTDAMNNAIASFVKEMDTSPKLAALPAAAAPPRVAYKGKVADVSSNTLILTSGSKDGVQLGDVVDIGRAGRTIYDPVTKKPIKVIVEPIGKATVTEVDESTATATFSGPGQVKLGDAFSLKP